MLETQTVIVGASAAGLACAAHLKSRNLPYILLEKEAHVGQAWRNHYDRLRLHTHKGSSNLPFVPFPKQTPKYPSKSDVIEYLEHYAESLDLQPIFNQEVVKIYREGGQWVTATTTNRYVSTFLVLATGNANKARKYSKPGIESFPGKIIHSSEYKNGTDFKGKKVLVVGFGNSACEIAMDLTEHGAETSISVRSAVNVLPKEILGIPVLKIGIWQSLLPAKLADTLNKPVLALFVGDIEKYGLKKLPYGAIEQIREHHQVPLLDLGTMSLIKKGQLQVLPDVKSVDGNHVLFSNGISKDFDAIVTGIGYDHNIQKFLDLPDERLEDMSLFIKEQRFFGNQNLYFCGYYVSPTGMLREMNIESEIIAEDIAKKQPS